MRKLIFHIDVNNAFLSWTAVDLLKKGYEVDIRTIPSVIGGDEEARRGIVTAKSPIAKKMGVVTAEPLFMARRKCPNLKVFKGDYDLYQRESQKLYEFFLTITPVVERFSVDECFLDMTGTNLLYSDPIKLAYQIKDEIKSKFGITVNIGIAENKLCAKMASDFEKPDKVHTLFPNEIKTKLWPLPVGELFMIGKSSAKTLNDLGIITIGDLANSSVDILYKYFKNNAKGMIASANGIDDSLVGEQRAKNKTISTTMTLSKDYESSHELKKILLYQADDVGYQARKLGLYAKTIAVILRTNEFKDFSHQTKLLNPTNNSQVIYKEVCKLLDNCYKGELIRLIGIRLADFTSDSSKQLSFFEKVEDKSDEVVQKTIDEMNEKFGFGSIIPASLKKIEGDKSDK